MTAQLLDIPSADEPRYISCGPFRFCGDRSHGWVRVFGYGLWWKDRSRHRLYFSERNWYRPFDFAVGTWHFRLLGKRGLR